MSTKAQNPIGVIGAGTMGAGIAQAAASAGWSVKLFDVNQTLVDGAKQNLVKRGLSLKALDEDEPESNLSGRMKQTIRCQQGISSEKAKDIIKDIKNKKFKVNAQIQNDQIRITSKKIDKLRDVMAFIKDKNYPLHLQFLNYR